MLLQVRCIVPDYFLSGYEVCPLHAFFSLCDSQPSAWSVEAIARLHIHKAVHASCKNRKYKFRATGNMCGGQRIHSSQCRQTTFHVSADVWGQQPAARVDGHHAGCGGGAADQTHGGHSVAGLLQHLPVHVHREDLGLRAHAQEVQTHGGVSAHTHIWRGNRKLLVTVRVSSSNRWVHAEKVVFHWLEFMYTHVLHICTYKQQWKKCQLILSYNYIYKNTASLWHAVKLMM